MPHVLAGSGGKAGREKNPSVAVQGFQDRYNIKFFNFLYNYASKDNFPLTENNAE
jgi:hypothetical protein